MKFDILLPTRFCRKATANLIDIDLVKTREAAPLHSLFVKTARPLPLFLFLLIAHHAQLKPEIWVADKSIHVNFLD
jgi:hypothetical protein